MKSLVVALVSASVMALVLVAPACSDEAATPQPCTDVPPGGCPLSYGVACDDPTCRAVYACHEGNVWTLDHECPQREAGPDVAVDAAPPPDAAVPRDAAIDAPPGAFGGDGCEALQAPDCPLGFALTCPSGCCECEDLYVCENGGWSPWGTCSLDAGIVGSN